MPSGKFKSITRDAFIRFQGRGAFVIFRELLWYGPRRQQNSSKHDEKIFAHCAHGKNDANFAQTPTHSTPMPDEPRQLQLGKHGGDRRSEQAKAHQVGHENSASKLKPSEANTKVYWLARLDRDGHAELAAKVRAGELSATAAAFQVGFRKRSFSQARRRRFDVAALIG